MSAPLEAIAPAQGGILIQVKAVPGASRTRIVGWLGDHLKIAVAAPPEAGKANKAICQVLAEVLGRRHQDVQVITGAANPRKRIFVAGVSVEQTRQKLGCP
jgi:uncharacterized protein